MACADASRARADARGSAEMRRIAWVALRAMHQGALASEAVGAYLAAGECRHFPVHRSFFYSCISTESIFEYYCSNIIIVPTILHVTQLYVDPIGH